MKFIFNDGGREAAGFRGAARDCAVRAAAIASGMPYREIYDRVNDLAKSEPSRQKSNARTGVYRKTFDRLMRELGFNWTSCMSIGIGCTVHMTADELPTGVIVVRLSGHYCAVINGVCHDTVDCTRNGNRCVYGYWR